MKIIRFTKSTLFLSITLLLISCSTGAPNNSVAIENQSIGQSMYSDSVAEPVTLADYQRAEKFLAANTGKLIDGNILAQYWQDDDRLVYKRSTVGGSQYVVVDVVADVANEGKILLFDADRLLSALASFTEEELDAKNLDLSNLQLNATDNQLDFSFDGSDYSLNLNTYGLKQLEEAPSDEFLSPDNSKAAFIDGYNLWLRDTASNELTQLTFDGEENYGYATNNAGWLRDDGPVLLWSPDSQKIATFRHDGRNVGEMYLYSTQVGHVELDAWKYPLPGDDFIFMIERLVIHLGESSKIVKLNMPPDPHRSTTSDHIAGRGGIFLDVEWSADSESLSFVSSSRDHKVAQLRVADPENGEVRDVFTETTETYYESGSISANWRVLGARNEFLWYSEQDNWGHLYLHDLQTGKQKLQLTSGSWRVTRVYKVDLDNEQVYFTGSNRETGDPYYQYLYRINLDGTGLVNLTPEIANHVISWSDSENYFSDVFSTPTEAAQSVIRNTSGKEVLELETVDISALLADGWVAPEPFIVKSRDQITDIYGLLYKPSNFNPDKSYPVLNYLYPGPQSGSVGSRSFRASRNDKQALAELGFIVVELDAMGTPGRSKSFHDIYYGNMGDNGLPDQITGIRQLAAENSWMDLDRVGIWGHSGGGYASTAGIFRYPEFYKVAVSGAGNHDNRNYEDDWGEKWQGLLETYPESNPLDSDSEEDSPAATNYDNQANQLLAENLQGKLLLAHGMLDTNVHPSSTLLVVQALIDAEKDFDLVVLPNSSHGFGNRRYFMKRRWDYFVEHLAGSEPSTDFKFADNIR